MSEKSAQYLKDYLRSNGWTITDFAKITDISRWSIHKWLKGDTISQKSARRIRLALEDNKKKEIDIRKLID